MKMFRMTTMLVIVAVLLPAAAEAQNDKHRNRGEIRGDRKELRQDKKAVRDDALDLVRIQKLRDDFANARAAGDVGAIKKADNAVRNYLAGENAEAGREVVAAKKEVKKDRKELRSDKKEIRKNNKDDASPGERGDDRRDKHDDRRDQKDDRQDASVEMNQAANMQRIRNSWESLRGNYGVGSLDERSRLLDDLVSMAKGEMGQDAAEIREDKGELKEDRRETREDKKEK